MIDLHWTAVDFAQIALAALLGALIGIGRELHDKPAGIKTMSIVTLGSTLVMQLSIKLPAEGALDAVGDPARLAAAVMTGIGFLGAGVILRTGASIHGITTAATIWFMAAVGLAIGAGYYVPALFAVGLVYLLFLLDPLTDRFVEWRRRRRAGNGGRQAKGGSKTGGPPAD